MSAERPSFQPDPPHEGGSPNWSTYPTERELFTEDETDGEIWDSNGPIHSSPTNNAHAETEG